MRFTVCIVLVIGALYVLAGIALYAFQNRLLYVPEAAIKTTPAASGMPYEEIALVASDGVRLTGWYMPLAGARGTVLFCHGNAGNISYLLDVAAGAHKLGLGVLLFDYRGYGQSEGVPSEEGTYRDAAAAWDYLVAEAGVSPERIVVIGRSLGGPIAAWLAREKQPAALFLEETFTSIPELGRELYPIFPVGLLARYRVSHAGVPKAGPMPGADKPQPRRHVYRIRARAAAVRGCQPAQGVYRTAGRP